MKIVIFGASGRTGQHLVEQALEAGHDVTALVRNPAKMNIQNEKLTIVQGDVQDAEMVEKAVAGNEAVLMALGHASNSPKDILTTATENVLAAMKKHNVRRLVNVTGAGVRFPQDTPKLFDKVMGFLLKRMAGDLLADSIGQVELIKQSGLDWVIVRVPMLNDKPRQGHYRVGWVGQGVGSRITRADVADFMLAQISDDTYLGQAPMISN